MARSKLGLQAAADGDVEDEERGHHQAGQDACKPKLGHRGAGDHGVKHQNHRRRDQDAKGGTRLNDARHHLFLIAAAEEFGQRDGGPDGHARDGKPVHGRDQHHQKDRPDGKAARNGAEPDMEHAVKVIGEAALAHDVAHKDEHGQRQERIPFHQLHRLREAHIVPPRPPERHGGKDGHEADDPKDPLPRHHHEEHGREHQGGDHLVGHRIGSPRMVAMSLAKAESA